MNKMNLSKGNVNVKARYLTIPDAKSYYNLGRDSIMRLAKESNALLRVGRLVRIDATKLDNYINVVCVEK